MHSLLARASLLLLIFLSACSGTPKRDTSAAPPDFALSVTVMDAAGNPHPVLTRALRPARYIMEPDQVLRASVGPGLQTTTYPPAIRTLSHRQVQQLWQEVVAGGYLNENAPQQVGGTEARTTVVVRPTALMYIAGDGRRRLLQIPLDGPDPAPVRLLDTLANLAWVSQ